MVSCEPSVPSKDRSLELPSSVIPPAAVRFGGDSYPILISISRHFPLSVPSPSSYAVSFPGAEPETRSRRREFGSGTGLPAIRLWARLLASHLWYRASHPHTSLANNCPTHDHVSVHHDGGVHGHCADKQDLARSERGGGRGERNRPAKENHVHIPGIRTRVLLHSFGKPCRGP